MEMFFMIFLGTWVDERVLFGGFGGLVVGLFRGSAWGT